MNPADLVRQLVRYCGRVEIGRRSLGRSNRHGHRYCERDDPVVPPHPRSEHAFLLLLWWVPGLPAYPQSLIVALFGSFAVRRRIEVWNPMESLLDTITVNLYYGIYLVKLIIAPCAGPPLPSLKLSSSSRFAQHSAHI